MPSLDQKRIATLISKISDGDARIGELLIYSVGRVCLNAARRGEDWNLALAAIDLHHIVDWLKAAVMNDTPWLRNVDNLNRPKKLIKFSNLNEIVAEADKAMLKELQKIGSVKIMADDEELFMELENGYRLVRLLTPAALDREGKEMQHCIGGGAYDNRLNKDDHLFLSLRDKNNKLHATIDVENGILKQFKGKQNKAPNLKYAKQIKPFILLYRPKIGIPVKHLGYIVSAEGDIHNIDKLPKSLRVWGNLDLNSTDIDHLPEELIIGGDLNLKATKISKLPDNLQVEGSLDIRQTDISTLPDNLNLNGDLLIANTHITKLPTGLSVGGHLDLINTDIKTLPSDLKVYGDINAECTTLETLPEGLQVNGYLNLARTPIKEIPQNIMVKGFLDLSETAIKTLPKGIIIGGDLYLESSQIMELPENLRVGGGALNVAKTRIERLPEGLSVDSYINISETNIDYIPETIANYVTLLTSKGEIKAGQFRERQKSKIHKFKALVTKYF